jgi:hypothetical protein
MNQIWQMKKSGEWNWKKISILYINSNKTNKKNKDEIWRKNKLKGWFENLKS